MSTIPRDENRYNLLDFDPVKVVQWVAALVSGEFEQGHNALIRRDESGRCFYCCLGVPVVLAQRDGVQVTTDDPVSDDEEDSLVQGTRRVRVRDPLYDATSGCSYLPPSVAVWFGLDEGKARSQHGDPWLAESGGEHYGNHVSCAKANDDAEVGWSFQRIAFEIEQRFYDAAVAGEGKHLSNYQFPHHNREA